MPEIDFTRKSRPVVISPYQARWPEEFRTIGGRIRELVGAVAVRIDHIGSTAVPGLGAKDVIDVQVTVGPRPGRRRGDSATSGRILPGRRVRLR